MKKNTPGCTCCACEDATTFSDDFSTTKTGYTDTSSSFFVDSGKLSTTASGSYYRGFEKGNTENLRIVVSAKMYQDNDATRVGIFIGGIASLYMVQIAPDTAFKLWLGVGCDSFGNDPTATYDLGVPNYVSGISQGFNGKLEVEHDWTNTGHFFIRATGSVFGQYAAEVTVTIPDTINIGMMGDGGFWDDFLISKNKNANKCVSCIKSDCVNNQLPRQLLLSVPEMISFEDGCFCEQLVGDFTLEYKTYANITPCIYNVGCCWQSDSTGQCGVEGQDPCGVGVIWQLYQFGSYARLICCNTSEWLEYRCLYTEFNCDSPTTLTYHSPFEIEGCDGRPDTLMVVPI